MTLPAAWHRAGLGRRGAVRGMLDSQKAGEPVEVGNDEHHQEVRYRTVTLGSVTCRKKVGL